MLKFDEINVPEDATTPPKATFYGQPNSKPSLDGLH
jgi:hypothetical protein